MSSASLGSATRFRMKLRSRVLSRSIAAEMRSSCSAIIHCFLSAASTYPCRRMSERNILEDLGGVRCIDFASAAAAVETAYELQYLPMDYLLKTEPTVYSFADLEREKTTIWDGVTNPAAVKHLREMKPGERLVIYHTGDEKSAVGTASVVSVGPR